jgi:RsmE family RNA methyltransferase
VNLLLLDPGELRADGTARIQGRRAAHVAEVLGAAGGDRIKAGVIGGRMGEAVVLSAAREEVILRPSLDRDPPAPSPVSLLVALPRPKILRKVLQAAAAMGIGRIALVGTYRVEKSYFGSPLLAPEALEGELRLGLEQGRDTILPVVTLHRHFKPFVEDHLDREFPAGSAVRLLAHPHAPGPVDAVPCAGPAAVVAIGPEGGFTPYEAETLATRGFTPFSLGPRPLRVDVAVPFTVAQVELWLRRDDPGLRSAAR